ncbi:MAG: Dihydroorotate dehydrogenase B (NAD(+)), catalytic subunit [Spirochaetes bacterium ADurb.Bin218]|nr:MAG: Dihydroorotate dehydrogenase B (NAD(+)), catalytic subunit [Spirochaetes bacterium ADurb.Bin218]
MDTKIKIGDLILKNPITVASGTAGYGEEMNTFFDISRLGAIFTKGLSLQPRKGNYGNRVLETPSGLLNSIGLENVGVEEFLDKKLPFLLSKGATPIPNIAGHTIEENIELCKILSNTKGIDAVELNVSCPNVKQGGMAFGTNMEIFCDLIKKARKATSCALIVKLSPNVTDVASFAIAAEELGADAVSAVNTFLGMKIDIKTGKPHFNNKVAGLSGPAIKPMAVRIVYQVYEKIKIPIIGQGGISSLEDTLEFIMAGASAISIGTANLIEPSISVNILDELQNYMIENKISAISDIIGLAH